MELQNNMDLKLQKDHIIKLLSQITNLEKNNYYEESIPAYIVLKEVCEILDIDEIPLISVQNGNVRKILTSCCKMIEDNYDEKGTRELMKYHIAYSFFDEYDLD